jgi:hypothetical protein
LFVRGKIRECLKIAIDNLEIGLVSITESRNY